MLRGIYFKIPRIFLIAFVLKAVSATSTSSETPPTTTPDSSAIEPYINNDPSPEPDSNPVRGVVDTTINWIVGSSLSSRRESPFGEIEDWPLTGRPPRRPYREYAELRAYDFSSMIGLWDVVKPYVTGHIRFFDDSDIQSIFEICVKAGMAERGHENFSMSEEELPDREILGLELATFECINEINFKTALLNSREEWQEVIDEWSSKIYP